MEESPESLQELQQAVCTCSLCSGPCRQPRALPCLHSFCRPCLNTYLTEQVKQTGKSYVPCPRCHQPTPLPTPLPNKAGSGHHTGQLADLFPEDSFVSKLNDVIAAYSPDKSCDLCHRRNVDCPASNWCMDCHDAVCGECAKVHLHATPTADHTVLDLHELRQLSLDSVMKRQRPVPCAKHQGQTVTLYCVDCKAAACVQCVAVLHRKCVHCVTASDAVSAAEGDMAEAVIRLQSLPEEGLNTGSGDAIEVLEETVCSSRERIKRLAADMVQKIEASAEQLLQELEATQASLRAQAEGGRNGPSRDHTKTLRAANHRMQYLVKYGSDVELLQTYDTIKDALSRLEGTANREEGGEGEGSSEDDLMFRVNFMPDDPVKVFQRDYKTLGHIQVEDCNSDEGLSSWGVTCTSRDEIIVVDCRNKRMQKFTSNGELIDHIQMSFEPRDVTSYGADDVAITIMKKQIFIVVVTGQMALKSRINTQKQYDAISYSSDDNCFLVSCLADVSVDVINKNGDILKSFNVDGTGSPIFLNPRYVTFSQEGNYVISDVTTNSVQCISPEGTLVFSYRPSGAHVLRKPQGLCTDNIGNIFIADYANSRIQLVTNEGAFQRFVLARESGIQRPVAIHISSTNKLVVVQSDGMVKVFSYDCPGKTKVRYKVTCWCPRCLANMEKDQAGQSAAE